MTAITQYVGKLRRRHDPEHSRFPLLGIAISRNGFATQQETAEFMAAAIFPLAETWARNVKVEGCK